MCGDFGADLRGGGVDQAVELASRDHVEDGCRPFPEEVTAAVWARPRPPTGGFAESPFAFVGGIVPARQNVEPVGGEGVL